MAAANSAQHRKARWTLVDQDGSIQGSDSDDASSSSSSDCVAVEDDTVHYRSKKRDSKTTGDGLTSQGQKTALEDSLFDAGISSKSSASASWLGSLWSKTPSPPEDVDTGFDVISEGKSLPEAKDDVDTESMESIEVLSLPSDHHDSDRDYADNDDRAHVLNLDHLTKTGSQQVQSDNVVDALLRMDAVSPLRDLSPTSSRVEDIVSSSGSSQLDFLLVEHPEENESEVATPTHSMAPSTSAMDRDSDDRDGFECSVGTAGPLPIMPQSELPMSSVSVDNIPRGVAAGGSPRRVQSTGNIPKRVGPPQDNEPHLENVPIMTQRWPTEDGGFLLVQQFRGDGEPAVSCSSSFSDLSSSLSYSGLARRIPDNDAPHLQRQSSDASSEATHYSDASDDSLPANMTVSGMTPGIRQYLHKRDEGFNSKLTMAACLVLTAGVALVIGHYIGSTQATSHHLDIEAGQVWRLRSLQDQLVTCLAKTKNLFKLKGTVGSSPVMMSSSSESNREGMPAAESPAQEFQVIDQSTAGNIDSLDDSEPISCSACTDPDQPNTRYSRFCNTECTPGGTSTTDSETSRKTEERDETSIDILEEGVILEGGDDKDINVHLFPQGLIASGDGYDKHHGQLLREEEEEGVALVASDPDGSLSESKDVSKCHASALERSELGGVWADLEDNADTDEEQERRDTDEVADVMRSEEGGYWADIETEPDVAKKVSIRDTIMTSGKMQKAIEMSNAESPEGGDFLEENTGIDDPTSLLDFSVNKDNQDEELTDNGSTEDLQPKTTDPEVDTDADQEFPEISGGTLMERLSSNLGNTATNSWSILRNYTSRIVKSASHISYDNVRSQLKENVQSLRHQIKEASNLVNDAASGLQKSNITSQLKESFQSLGGKVQDTVSTLQNSTIPTNIRETIQILGEQVQDAISGLKKSNITSQIKEGVKGLGDQVQDAIKNLHESNVTTKIKGGVQSVRKHIKRSFKSFKNVLKGKHASESHDDERDGSSDSKKKHGRGSKKVTSSKKGSPDKFGDGDVQTSIEDKHRSDKGHDKNKDLMGKKEKKKHKSAGDDRTKAKNDRKHQEQTENESEARPNKRWNSSKKGTKQSLDKFENGDVQICRKDKKHKSVKGHDTSKGMTGKKGRKKHKSTVDAGTKANDRKHRERTEKETKSRPLKRQSSDQKCKRREERNMRPSKFVNRGRPNKRNKERKNGEEIKKFHGTYPSHEDKSKNQQSEHGKNHDRESGYHKQHGHEKQNRRQYQQEHKNTKDGTDHHTIPGDWTFKNIDWESVFDGFDVRCHGVHDCLRNQREAALKLYEELLHYKDWLVERCYKKHLDELTDFMEELEEFLSEPTMTDDHLEELKEDFEDMAEDMEKATKKYFKKFMRRANGSGHSKDDDPSDVKVHHQAPKQHQKPHSKTHQSTKEKALTVTLDLQQVLNASATLDKKQNDDSSGSDKRKHAGYGYQSNEDWFVRRMQDREEQRREHGNNEPAAKDRMPTKTDSKWYQEWMKGREEARTGVTVWDMYEWFSKRQALRHEWRVHEMDDQSNWFLRRP